MQNLLNLSCVYSFTCSTRTIKGNRGNSIYKKWLYVFVPFADLEMLGTVSIAWHKLYRDGWHIFNFFVELQLASKSKSGGCFLYSLFVIFLWFFFFCELCLLFVLFSTFVFLCCIGSQKRFSLSELSNTMFFSVFFQVFSQDLYFLGSGKGWKDKINYLYLK